VKFKTVFCLFLLFCAALIPKNFISHHVLFPKSLHDSWRISHADVLKVGNTREVGKTWNDDKRFLPGSNSALPHQTIFSLPAQQENDWLSQFRHLRAAVQQNN